LVAQRNILGDEICTIFENGGNCGENKWELERHQADHSLSPNEREKSAITLPYRITTRHREVVDESSAILVDPLDVEAIADCLGNLKRNEALRRRLGKSALERARRTDLAARAGHIRNWLESVVGSQPR
jgi:hypothetical protein